MTASPEPITEPLHIGRLLGETLCFIFTRPHLWLVAWAPGFVLAVAFGFWVWDNPNLFNIVPRKVIGFPTDVLLVLLSCTLGAGLVTPLIYRRFFIWRTSSPGSLTRGAAASFRRGVPLAALLCALPPGFLITFDLIANQVWAPYVRFITIVLTWLFWLLLHNLIVHLAAALADGDRRRSWRANLRMMRGRLRALYFGGVPLAMISLGLMFVVIATVALALAALTLTGHNWRLAIIGPAEDLFVSALFAGAYFTAALPFQVFHSAARIRMLEINEGSALGANVRDVFQ